MSDLLPFTTFNFWINLELPNEQGVVCGAEFSDCDGLEMNMTPKTIREGGNNAGPVHLMGPVGYAQLTLKRGMTRDFGLWRWFERTQREHSLRASAEVKLMAPNRTDVNARFLLTGCLPVKLKAPALAAKEGLLAIEEMQLVYETLTLEEP